MQTPGDLLVLQHPDEARESKNSAGLLALCLPQCRIEVGEVFDHAQLQQMLQADGRQAWLLYPQDGNASPPADLPPADRLRLVLLDATWRKSRRMLAANAPLQGLPRLALPAALPARYRIRKAHRPGQLSTLEAACHALGMAEGQPERYAPVLAAFEAFVQMQLALQAQAMNVRADAPQHHGANEARTPKSE